MKSIVFALALLGVLSLLGILYLAYFRAKLRALGMIEYTRSFSSDGIFVGETIELIETVRNPGWFPLFAVRMDFFAPAGVTIDGIAVTEYTKLASIFNIPPYSTVTKKHTIKADKRCHYQLHNASIICRKFYFLFESPAEFYAYPDCFSLKANCSADLYLAGNAIASRKYIEDPFFVSSIRDYRAGDPMRAVNYKATVRSFSGGTRRLLCNNYDSSRTYDSMIFLDLNTYAQAGINAAEHLETGLQYACYLFCEALKNGGRVGFSANCSSGTFPYIHIPCGSGDIHAKRILEQFSLLDNFSKRDYSMTAILKNVAFDLPNDVDIYIITPLIDGKTADVIYGLRQTGKNVQVIHLTGGETQ